MAWKIAERRAEKKKEKRDTAGAMSVVDHLKFSKIKAWLIPTL